jgi:hypothetical protein
VYVYPSTWNFGKANEGTWGTITGDFNGDGQTDFARIGPTYAHFFLSKGNGTFDTPVYTYPPTWNFGPASGAWGIISGDFNGDGKTDFARLGPTYAHFFVSKGDGTFDTPVYTYPATWNFGPANGGYWGTITGDFNGDGKTDFAQLGPTYAHCFLSRGDGTFDTPVYTYPESARRISRDLDLRMHTSS